ncbi:hypothetical protein B0T21DRAFT_361337, partial [Apiosordaria backusii]
MASSYLLSASFSSSVFGLVTPAPVLTPAPVGTLVTLLVCWASVPKEEGGLEGAEAEVSTLSDMIVSFRRGSFVESL